MPNMRGAGLHPKGCLMPGGRPRGATISQLKLPPVLRMAGTGSIETAHTKMSATRPDKPASLPESLSELWESTVDSLDDAGLLAKVDGPTLELALRHYLAALKASDALMLDGPTMYDNKNEREMKNPASQVFRDHSTAFLEFAKQLGLSFVSRARVTMAKDGDGEDGNPFAVNQ